MWQEVANQPPIVPPLGPRRALTCPLGTFEFSNPNQVLACRLLNDAYVKPLRFVHPERLFFDRRLSRK